MTGVLNQAATQLRAEFEAEGYLHVQRVLSPTLVQQLAELCYGQYDGLSDTFQAATGVALSDASAVRTYAADLEAHPDKVAAMPVDIRDILRGQFPQSVRTRDELLGLTGESALLAILNDLLGTDQLRLHFPPMVRFKTPAQDHVNVPLHQDAPTSTTLRRSSIAGSRSARSRTPAVESMCCPDHIDLAR
jgi:hypothetical protein